VCSSDLFSLPAVASSAAIASSSAALTDRIHQLEAERDEWQRKAMQQRNTASITQQPAADYTKLKEALETSKTALAKAIATINKQNETLQALKGQVGELRTGLDSSTLDQQTYLNEELNKAEQAQKTLQQKLADAERENAALKLVVDGLKKQQAALEEKQAGRLSNAEALPTQEGWKRSGSK
jgi:chromosome segregation ATPase